MSDSTTPPTGGGRELAVFDPTTSKFPAIFDDGEGGVAQILEDNFGDEGFSTTDLDRLTVPSGGGTAWDIPDEAPARTVEGVVIHRQPTRSMWFKKRGEDGEEDGPPDCYSNDGKVGIGVFGPGSDGNKSGVCAECPMNVFGSSTTGSGTGKACKEQMQVFVLQEGSVLPIQISLPPTSLKPWRKYMTRLAAKGKSYMSVVTGFTLSVEKSGGQTYSVVQPARIAELAPAEFAAVRSYGSTIAGALSAANAARMAAEAAARDAEPVVGETQPLEDTAPPPAEAAPAAAGAATS